MTLAESHSRPWRDVRGQGADLVGLMRFDGGPQTFWPAYLEAVGTAFAARRALLFVLSGDRPWQACAQWPAVAEETPSDAARALALVSRVVDESPLLDQPAGPDAGGVAVAMRLDASPREDADATALVVWPGAAVPVAAGWAWARTLAGLAASVPGSWRAAQHQPPGTARTSTSAAERLYDLLQVSIRLGDETRFVRAVFSLCNDLSVRFGAERVSLGWIRRPYVRLAAMSHVENFDARASATRELESAMEEAWKQESEVAWPQHPGARTVARAHEAYARAQGCGHLLSLPLNAGGHAQGVLTLERRARPFDDDELFELRLFCEACARPLSRLRQADRWFGAKLALAASGWLAELLGPRHLGWKLAGSALVLAALLVTFLPWDHRIETPLVLRSQDVLFVPAPFDGYLRQVGVEVGDTVRAGAVMLELDTRELVLEESMALAEDLRLRREVEKSQAGRQLGDMQVALARQQQSASKLELLRHQLAHAKVKAPFEGVVIEGDLKRNLGAPVRKGDLLLKLANIGQTYLEIEIDQADVHAVTPGMRGEFAFVGRPELRYPIVVERIDPVATQREGRNVFLARARTEATFQPWWRPGMGGAARLEAGQRSLLWVMTQRTVRYLRHVFWL